MGQVSCLFVLLCLGVLASQVRGDVYMHSMRGSNNRLDEANRDRANGNRLFDSQNNNRGGYNVGGEYYFVGEEKAIEWTNQHACAQPNVKCEIIIQYMCDPLLRDGTSTNRIPENAAADVDYEYGRQESYEWYRACKTRQRNMGLFTASQQLNGNTAIYTRQNPNGQRRGFECPEERDYYPYWHPTPWRDVAVFTDQPERNCGFYRRESQNVRNKGYCHDNVTLAPVHPPNNRIDCENFDLGPNRSGVWMESGAWNIDPPVCTKAPWSRDNHLGNGLGGQPNSWVWKMPNVIDENCAMRIRYNISTLDYDGWDSRVNASLNDRGGEALMSFIDTERLFGTNTPVANGYVFENNPQVNIGLSADLTFQLAINTAQFGRTFQDRSHRFAIRARPDVDRIVSLSVRGKRGNIVQVFPSVEYDFFPNDLEVTQDDYIHLQWSGSNTNPGNNDGQGRQQTDRQNFVELYDNDLSRSYPRKLEDSRLANATEYVPYIAKYFWSRDFGTTFGGELSELDDSGPYGSGGLFRITRTGEYNYMCTRNNNFSNRGQKARIVVSDGSSDDEMSTAVLVGIVVASVGFVLIMASIALALTIYFNKQAKIAKRERFAAGDDSGNPFSPLAEDSL